MNKDNLITIASFIPGSLQSPNAWAGHLPFAAWIIQEVSPKIFVELGTHTGNSYFSFCQAVVEAELTTKCYAVDTWQGDEHAGQYNDEIFTKVNEHHQERYAGFSRLLRMTFDDAVTYFADKSIDLLHIDGLHTYEAVRHDFETWLPKLAPGAVVMFHDTNVREHNFGVWEFWEELQARYPNNLEFMHSHGLGVLQLNNAPDNKKLEWLQPNSPEKQQLINYFSALGSRQLERFELNELKQNAATLNQAVHDKDVHIDNLEHIREEGDKQIASLQKINAELDGVIKAIMASTTWRLTQPLRTTKLVIEKVLHLMKKNITPRDKFDAEWYLKRNPDVAMNGMDPYKHYVLFGKAEGRRPRPDPFMVRNINRARIIYLALLAALRRDGGLMPIVKSTLRASRTEGVEGVKKRILSLCNQSSEKKEICQAYKNYIKSMEPIKTDLDVMKEVQSTFSYKPKFSIAVPVYNVKEEWLRRCIESVRSQVYPNWELCIADDCSTSEHIRPLLEGCAALDDRIKVVFRKVNGHISAATNSAIEMATGDFMCLMDNDDEIAPNALFEFASLMQQDDQVDMIYSDEDKLDMRGNRYEPFFKPDWSPEALEGCMYTAHFACYRMNIVRELGGFRVGYDGAQDYDFVLRFTERAKKIVHTPKILYHWRAIPGSTAATMNAKDYVLDAAVRSLRDRAKRVNGGGEVKLGRYAGSFDVRYSIQGSPLVSIVIPSAGREAVVRGESVDLLSNVVKSIYEKNTYRNFEIIIVDNGDLRQETIKALSPYNCSFVHFNGRFNIAAKMNMGAREAKGEYLLFMNDDIEVIADDWMECMLQLAQRLGIGAVGAKLHFENGKIQHVGVAFWNGLPDHIRREFPETDAGYFFSTCSNRNYLAVTGAVLMTRRSIFEKVNGFDERFAINYNDVDYCLKVVESGERIVFASGAELYHFESISRERTVADDEVNLFRNRWGKLVSSDPYYSSNFEAHPPNFILRNDWAISKE